MSAAELGDRGRPMLRLAEPPQLARLAAPPTEPDRLAELAPAIRAAVAFALQGHWEPAEEVLAAALAALSLDQLPSAYVRLLALALDEVTARPPLAPLPPADRGEPAATGPRLAGTHRHYAHAILTALRRRLDRPAPDTRAAS